MLTIIQAVSKSECNAISELANTIWKEHYTPIIGVDQVNYMLEKFQSSKVIFKQIQNYCFSKFQTILYINYKTQPKTFRNQNQ